MDPDKTLVEWAMRDLQCFGAETREEAAVALEMWSPMRKLRERSVDAAAEVTDLVLARFSPAEPPAVPGLDWLPSPDEVASYNAAVAESLAVPAQVKAVPAVERHCDDCGHAESRHSRLNCNGINETERCRCYAFRLPEPDVFHCSGNRECIRRDPYDPCDTCETAEYEAAAERAS